MKKCSAHLPQPKQNKMSKKKKITIAVSACVCLAVFVTVWLMLCGYLWTWGPFSDMANLRFQKLPGNAETYAVENVEPLPSNPLAGKHILYLGSSVTYGASSLQTSFVEYIAKRNDTTYQKEAVSGTTLVDEGVDSYISRLQKADPNESFDLFVCQLSTNDATQKKPLGTVSASGAQEFDISTVCGAVEHIITYVRETWNCPVVFYTNAYYDSEEYAAMVEALYEIAEKYDIGIIDLYTDRAFNDIDEAQRALYMADSIHPTKAGYLEWWTPVFENKLKEVIKNESN